MQNFLLCHPPHHMTVRNRLGRISERLEQAGRSSADLADAAPKGGFTVFLDGAHIRCRPEYKQRHLDLVVGKIENRHMCRRFGLVVNATASPRNRMRDELLVFGWRPGRLLTVISDGEPALPNLIRNAIDGDGQVKHILDWRHLYARAACRGGRTRARSDRGVFRPKGVVRATHHKPPLVAVARQSKRRRNLSEKGSCLIVTASRQNRWLSELLPHACRPAARRFTPTSRITRSPSWTTAAGIVLGCRFRHLAQKVRSMTLPSPDGEA